MVSRLLYIFIFCFILLRSGLLPAQGLSYQCLADQNINVKETFTILTQSRSGHLWLGNTKGIWTYDGQDIQQVGLDSNLQDREPTALFEDSDRRSWVGFDDGQIAREDALGQLRYWEPEEG
ncbi:MAG: hypothetical protein D6772_09430, partial [Bacteroidetes bacterium]